MKRQILAALLATGTILTTPHAVAVTLNEAVVKAIETHPEVNASRQNREAILHEWRQAKSGWYPTIELAAGTGYEFSENATTRAATGSDESLWRNEARITLRQMLFDGHLTEAETCQQRERYNSATFNIRENKRNDSIACCSSLPRRSTYF